MASYKLFYLLNLWIKWLNSKTGVGGQECPHIVVVRGAAKGRHHLAVLLHDLNHLPGGV